MRPKNAHSDKPKKGEGGDKDPFLKSLNKLSADLKVGAKGSKSKVDPRIEKKMLVFRKQFRRLKKQYGAGAEDFKSDQNTRSLYRAMLAMTIELIPIAEQKYLESSSESAIYSLNALLNQVKDLNDALRKFDDLEAQAQHICQRIITPAMMRIMQNGMTNAALIKNALVGTGLSDKQMAKINRKIDDGLRAQASYITENQKGVSDSVEAYLLGD